MTGRLVRILQASDNGIAAVERTLLAIGVLGMTVVSVGNVLMRNVLGTSLVFADELNQILIILITFIGIGYAARQGRHIRMTALYDELGRLPRKLLMVTIALLTAALLLTLAWYSLQYVMHVERTNAVTPALRIPVYLSYAVAPIGLVLGAVQYLLAAIRNLVERDVYVSFAHTDGYEEQTEADSTARRI